MIAVPFWLIGVLALSSRLVAGWLVVERCGVLQRGRYQRQWLSRVKIMADRLRVTRPVRSRRIGDRAVVRWLSAGFVR